MLKQLPRTALSVSDVKADHLERYHKNQMNFEKNLNLSGKYCYHPFNTVTIDNRGECYVCVCQAWLPISVGNILEFNSLDEIVQSPKAREIQASIIDGTYKYCDHTTCHIINSNNLQTRIDHKPDTVNWIVFALDDSCNLSCPSCRNELIFHNKGDEFDRRMAISDHIVKLIENHNHWLKFTLSGDGDPFASHIYRNMLEKLNINEKSGIEVEIVTNGILVKSHWHRMSGVHNNVVRMRISFDAGTSETYTKTRRGGDWDKLIENCRYIIKWKEKYYSNMEIQAAFVVQTANFREIHEYVRLTKQLGFDSILLQKVTDWGKWIDSNGVNHFYDHAVWQEDHAYYNELVSILNDPVLDDPIVDLTNLSPLKNAKNRTHSLVDLVNLKQTLNLEILEAVDVVDATVTDLHVKILKNNPNCDKFDEEFNTFNRLASSIKEKITFLKGAASALEKKYNTDLEKITRFYYQPGYKINGATVEFDSDYLTERTRVTIMSEDTENAIASSVQRYVNWQYPGLEIGPGDGYWTKLLVGCDPLYLVDVHQEFLISSLEQFSEEYRRRVRTYKINDIDLDCLPQNQFGFVFAWYVFNFMTADMIDLYLGEIMKVLRPGGIAMFSYNNAERPHAANFVETGFMSYMPKTYLLRQLKKYGFEILASHDLETAVSWVEIKKPGELSTVKAHQAMASIIHRV